MADLAERERNPAHRSSAAGNPAAAPAREAKGSGRIKPGRRGDAARQRPGAARVHRRSRRAGGASAISEHGRRSDGHPGDVDLVVVRDRFDLQRVGAD